MTQFNTTAMSPQVKGWYDQQLGASTNHWSGQAQNYSPSMTQSALNAHVLSAAQNQYGAGSPEWKQVQQTLNARPEYMQAQQQRQAADPGRAYIDPNKSAAFQQASMARLADRRPGQYQQMMAAQSGGNPAMARSGGGLLGQPQGGMSAAVMPQGQSSGNPQLQAYSQNPYLAQMGQGLQSQFTDFMNQGLAANRGGAVVAGGVGGNRQALAEGQTIGNASTGFANALSTMYGNDYQQQMARNLQQYQGDQQYTLGQGNLALGHKNANNSFALGQGQLQLGNKQADNAYSLGQGQLGLGYHSANQQYQLGQQANQNQATQIGNNYTLGQGNLALGQTQAANQYNLGLGQNQNQATQIEKQFALGEGSLNYQNRALGMSNANQQQQMRDAFYLGNRGMDLTNQGQGLNFYSNLLNTAASGGYAPQNGGFDWGKAIGGGLAGLQFGKNMGWGW